MIESDDDQKSGSADGSLEEGYGNLTVSKLVATGNVIGSHEVQDESISGFTAEMMERIELPGQLDRSLWSQESSAPRYDKLTVLRGEKAKIYKGLDSLSSKVIVIIENEADDGERLLTLGTPGAGDMTATFESDEQGQPPATLENLHWSGWMMFGSKANRALFTGLVHNRVRGTVKHSPTRTSGLRTGKLELFLKPEPVTELDKTLASSRELISAEPFFEPMAQRKLDNMVLTGSSEVRSVEHPVGDPTTRLRSAWLKSDKLNYRTQAGLFTTGGPGTLLLEDYRETKTEVTADPPAAGVETGQPSDPPDTTVRKGQTAFIWKTSAKYDQEEQQAILTGDVYMNAMGYGVSLPTRTKGEKTNTPTQRRQTQLWCQKLTVRFADSHPDGGPEDTTAPPVADLSAMDEMKISQVRASKDVVLKSGASKSPLTK